MRIFHGALQSLIPAAEDPLMETPSAEVGQPVPEHFLASLYGILALVLGATVWSAMAAVFGAWSLPVVPGLGWLVAWACRYGGRRTDGFVRVAAWLLALAGVQLALLMFSVFSATLGSPDSGSGLRSVGLEYLRLFAEPPWFGSAAVILALAGARRALRDLPARRTAGRPALELACPIDGARPGAPRSAAKDPGSRAA
jgi:hypothetical protein